MKDNDGHFGRQRDICPGHMAQVSSRLLITLGRTNNIRSEDPSFVGLAMRPLSISLLCAVMAFNLEGGQFGQFLAHSAKTKNRGARIGKPG